MRTITKTPPLDFTFDDCEAHDLANDLREQAMRRRRDSEDAVFSFMVSAAMVSAAVFAVIVGYACFTLC